MQTYPLQLDSLDVKKPGLWPWVIGITALLTLAFCLTRVTNRIERSLQSAAVATVSAIGAHGVTVDVDGRDMTLSGSLSASIDRTALVATLTSMNGIRVVEDDMIVIDPVARARTEKVNFQQMLAAIDASRVAFEPNSASLSLGSEAVLLQTTKLLRANPDRLIKIAGHTDNSGNAQPNLELSRQRAQAVASFLTDRGIPAQQLIVQGYGHTRPLYANDSEEGRAKNRRIEFIYMK